MAELETAERPYRPVSFSRTSLSELMIPSYANFGGKVHGGILLALMDKIAYACASKHAGTYCVTVRVDTVNFRAPVEVGNLVTLRASVNYVGRTSLVIGIRVEAESITTGVVRHTNTSYFTMVAKNESDQACVVPGLVLETIEDVSRYLEAVKRRKLDREHSAQIDIDCAVSIETDLHLLAGHRCRVAPELGLPIPEISS